MYGVWEEEPSARRGIFTDVDREKSGWEVGVCS